MTLTKNTTASRREESCIICEKKYITLTTQFATRRMKVDRPRGALTCSKECSRVYGRIRRHFDVLHKEKLKEIRELVFKDELKFLNSMRVYNYLTTKGFNKIIKRVKKIEEKIGK